MSRLGALGHKLYSGEVSYDIVGKAKRWYAISGAIVLIALLSLFLRGLNLGIEFTGGAEYQVPVDVMHHRGGARPRLRPSVSSPPPSPSWAMT